MAISTSASGLYGRCFDNWLDRRQRPRLPRSVEPDRGQQQPEHVVFRADPGWRISGGTGGSLTKTGTGTLTLAGANTYTGGTIIQSGKLLVTTNGASATGTGAVLVNAGTLAGTSRLSGAMTVGTGSGTGAFLAPGVSGPGVLTTRRTLTFNSDATYVCELTTTNRRSDQVVAKGVTINAGALFSFVSIGNRAIPAGKFSL